MNETDDDFVQIENEMPFPGVSELVTVFDVVDDKTFAAFGE